MLLPEVYITTETGKEGVTAWLHDGHSSWATLTTREGAGAGPGVVTYQGGPRRLADETARAWELWEPKGAPGLHDFGLTRTADEQWIWNGDPGGPRWHPMETTTTR